MQFLNHLRGRLAVASLTIMLAQVASAQTNPLPEILVTDATNYMNRQVVVRDVVVQVALRQTLALLNLNQKYPKSPLTCVIRADNTNKFPDLETYLGQRVVVSGRITEYQGRPQIILTSTNQIKILNDDPIPSPPPPATNEPATKAAAAVATPSPPPSATSTAQPIAAIAARPDRAVWWLVGTLGMILGLLGLTAFWFWRRSATKTAAPTPSASLEILNVPPSAATNPTAVQDWKQRALIAEAMAGRQGQILREKLMPELAEFAKQSLVQGLYAQRNALIETQQVAQQVLVEMETRLAALQLTLPERIRAYEQRISELEKEVETQGDEVRELTRATLVLVRKKLDEERERQRERTTGRFN